MALKTEFIPIDSLCERFTIAVNKPQTILTEHLEPIPGRLSSCLHDAIFATTLQILTSTQASAISNQTLLIKLRDIIHAYIEKVETAAKLALKIGRKATTFNPERVQRIFDRIKELHTEVCKGEPPQRLITPEDLKEMPLQIDADFIELRGYVCTMATEWHLYKALALASTAIATTQQLEGELLTQQYRLSRSEDGLFIIPPQTHFEAPWPILLLAFRLDKFKGGGIENPLIYENLIMKIVKAKEFYPHQATVLSGLLTAARYGEMQRTSALMVQETTKTLAMFRERVPKGAWGTVLSFLIESLDGMKAKNLELEKEAKTIFGTPYPTEELRSEAGECLARQEAANLVEIGGIFSQGVASFKAILPAFADSYIALFSKLKTYKTNPCQRRERDRQSAKILFTPAIPSPIFLDTSVFAPYSTPHFPSEEAIQQFTQPSISTRIDAIIQRYEERKSLSTSMHTQRDFLPKNVFSFSRMPHVASKQKLLSKHKMPFCLTEEASSCLTTSPPLLSSPLPVAYFPPIAAAEAAVEAFSKLSLQQRLPPSSFNFQVGDRLSPSFQFSRHVLRWKDPKLDPFRYDPCYRDTHYSPEVREAIRFQHTPPLALLKVILDYGEKYIHSDSVKESYYLPSEATWYDDSRRFEKGVVTVGRNRYTGEIFHYTFSQQAPSTLRQNYARNRFFLCQDEEEGVELFPGEIDPRKTIPDDGSVIHQIDDQGIGIVTVTVDDPIRKIRVDLFFEI